MQSPANKISVLIVVPSLECGGAERNVALICNHINSSKFDVCLAVTDHSKPFYQITNPAIRVVDLQCRHVRQSLWIIRLLTKDLKPDIILSAANHLNLLMAIFSWLYPKNTPIIARESSVVSVNSKRAKWPFLYEWLLKRYYKKLHLLICQSTYMQKDLVKHYAVPVEKTTIVYNALDIPTATHTRKDNGNDDAKKFITVARLSEEKGIDRILRSLLKLKIPFHYHIIGDGPMRSKLEEIAKAFPAHQKIFFSGSLQEPYTGMADADLFLMGSHYEGFPNVLIEANALGIPVVAFHAPGGIEEVVSHKKTGMLVSSDKENDFALAIEDALQFPFDRDWIKAFTRQRYDAANAVLQWENLFMQISGKKQP